MSDKAELAASDLPCIIGCGSSDAMALYEDNHVFCFSCGKRKDVTEEEYKSLLNQVPKYKRNRKRIPMTQNTLSGEYKDVFNGQIKKETCEVFGVKIKKDKATAQDSLVVFPYFDRGEEQDVISAKLKRLEKEKGKAPYYFQHKEGRDYSEAGLFGEQAWRNKTNMRKYITVTEGEKDCLAVSQMFGNKYATVSIKNGADSAAKDCKGSYEFLNSFDNIVLCFDADKPGRKAAKEVAQLFPPRKVKIVHLDYITEKYKDEEGDEQSRVIQKDAFDYLEAGKQKEFMERWWGAETHTPDGILAANTMWERLSKKKDVESVKYPWDALNDVTYGMRLGEVTTLIAPTGVGKTAVCRQIGYEILKNTGHNVGFLMLEESPEDTTLGLMSIHSQKPLHLPDHRPDSNKLREIYDDLFANNPDRVFLYDSFGSNDLQVILDKIQYFSQALGCKYIFLDHLSIIVSDQRHGDERKALDEIATKLKTFVMQNNIHLMQVSHINRDGEIRGTAAIEQLSNMIIRLERDKKNKNSDIRNTTVLTCEKNRFCGITGPAGYLKYDINTANLVEIPEEEYLAYESGFEGEADMEL